jgi:hypothetical protein
MDLAKSCEMHICAKEQFPMSEIINQIYEMAVSGERSVEFQLTTNHPDNATYAAGTMRADRGGPHSEESFQMPALVSQEVNWYFLGQETRTPPESGFISGHLGVDRANDYLVSRAADPLVLRLFTSPLGSDHEGSLSNRNWKEPIVIRSLQDVDHGNNRYVLYGLDSNGAAISIALKVGPSEK